MSVTRRSKEPVDGLPYISITAHPYTGHTVVTVDVATRSGGGWQRSRLAYWHLDFTRADLHGRTTDDVLRLICQRVLRRLESNGDAADRVTKRAPARPQAPAPLEGPQGEEIPQAALPGLEPTL